MNVIAPAPIPARLFAEVDEYLVPLPFEPESLLDVGANIGTFRLLRR